MEETFDEQSLGKLEKFVALRDGKPRRKSGTPVMLEDDSTVEKTAGGTGD